MNKLGQVLGAAALVLGGYCAGGATGCSSAHAGGDGGGSSAGGEPTIAATVQCSGSDPVSHAFPGKSVEWVAANVVALTKNPGGSYSIGAVIPAPGKATSNSCGPETAVEFLVR